MKEINKHILWGSALVITVLIVTQAIQTVKVDGKITCNTGFIGLDYQSEFKNQPYQYEIVERTIYSPDNLPIKISRNTTGYDTQFLPKIFNVKNIDGLNCVMEWKGEIPKSVFDMVNEEWVVSTNQ